jgi:hypothetical protein
LAWSLSDQGKYAEAEEMFWVTLAARRRVLGSSHPDTLDAVEALESTRSAMRAKLQSTGKRGGKATARTDRATVTVLSAAALAEAEARARAAEQELLAMLALDETASGSAKGKAKGKKGKRG